MKTTNKRKTKTTAILKSIRKKLHSEYTKPEKTFSPRHLARSIAKANMARAGVQRVNKHMALNWRKWVMR